MEWYNSALMNSPFPQSLPALSPPRRAAVVNFLANYGGLLVCGLFLLLGLALAGDYGINHDEETHRDMARVNLNYALGKGYGNERPIPSDRFYGVAFELPLLLAERSLGSENYYHIHRLRLTVIHLFFLVGGLFCYLLAYRLFNNRLIALFALLLFLLHPRIYAHSFFNSKDPPFLTMFVIALYLVERAFRKDTLAVFLLLGLAVGLLTNLRIMGLLLFAAVIGLRAFDVIAARSWAERREILITSGLFIAAAGLTWYALSPNAWSQPWDYLTGALLLAADHPHSPPTLFQGALIPSNELPPHYALTWFLISTPPPALLLGLVGIAALAGRALTRPGAILRNSPLRFRCLLLACFALPLLGIALTGSNIYQGWRLLYFIYAPFLLLAAGGLHWLAAALSPRRLYAAARPWRLAGAYAIAALALALTALQMAQLHPLQQVYFNFLVDRTTPHHLESRYEMDYWGLATRPGLEYILRQRPGPTVVQVEPPLGTVVRPAQATLPPAAQRRLLDGSGVHDAEYYIAAVGNERKYRLPVERPDLAFNSRYGSRVYNSDLVTVMPLDAANMEPAALAAYAEFYRWAVAGKPIIQGDYAVYLDDGLLTFVKEDCRPGDRAGYFGVKVFWSRPEQPPGRPPYVRYRNFYYDTLAVRLDDKCLALLRLPDTPIDYLVAGQYASPGKHPLWAGLHSFSRPGLPESIAILQEKEPLLTGGGFALYRQENWLIYYRESCSAAAMEPTVFLHTVPAAEQDLPPARREYGFDNRNFYFPQHGIYFDGQCLASVAWPDYPVAELRTGQAGIWAAHSYPLAAADNLAAAAAATAGAEPAARGKFDLYLRDNQLIYRRENCAADDTAARFFLHIVPVDAQDLPAARRPHGFDSRDFDFARYGGRRNGICLAVVPLPDYPIASIRAGQHTPAQGELWSLETGE